MASARQGKDLFKQLNKEDYFVKLFRQFLQFSHLALIVKGKPHALFSYTYLYNNL